MTAISHAPHALQQVSMSELRRVMVDCQLRTYDVIDKPLLAAMDTVPREAFVLPGQEVLAYLDRPVVLGRDADGEPRALMTPMVLARMIQALAVKPGEAVLDYAGGSGYSAAVLAQMGAIVTSVEGDAALLEMARSALASMGHGAVMAAPSLVQASGPYDAVLVNGACEIEPQSLLQLLSANGRLICVIGHGRAASVMLYQRSGDAIGSRKVLDAAAPMLKEFRKPVAFVF